MDINNYINAFSKLGEKLQNQENIPSEVLFKAEQQNNWFTKESVSNSITNLSKLLNEKSLLDWTSIYDFSTTQSKKIGVIMAGNIPLVGFTDFLAIIVSGHIAKIKLSSQDNILLPYMVDLLLEIEPNLGAQVEFIEQLKDIEAVIATGSDNTSRYFEYYFGKYPNIIRKNRSSCAVLNGKESPEAIGKLGLDIFQYYGLGCRNVSKVYIPKDYKVENLLSHLDAHKKVINHHKYNNNYDYNKSIYLVNIVKHYDNGYLLLTEDSNLVSPISVLFYETYNGKEHLDNLIANQVDKIQCIVSNDSWYKGSVAFGSAQKPNLSDYSDNIDVMSFLINLK